MENKSATIGLITRRAGIALFNLCICAAALANDSQDGASINIDGKEYSGQRVVTGEDVYGAGLALVQAKSDSTLSITNSTFENNYAKSNNTANGTYGVAVSATGANDVSIDTVRFDSNQVESVSQTQGVVYMSGNENVSVKNSEFVSNKAGAEGGTSYSAGGALSLWGNKSVSIEKTNFENNQTNADDWADGGALYARGAAWGGYEPSTLSIKDSNFNNNTLQSATSSRGGAVFLKSGADSDFLAGEIIDTAFSGNKSITTDAENAYGDQGGGAIYNESSKLKITATKDISNIGNSAIVGGNSDDARGGFLYMYSGDDAKGKPSTEFSVAENATLTIGDGTAGQDSIASNDSNSLITKTGAGTLTVNGSMKNFTGTLNVSEGAMNINNGLGGEANVDNAALNIANADYDGLVVKKPANGSPTAIINATNNAVLSVKDSSFKNNTAAAEGVANGTYGVAIGINSSNASIDNVVFENNTSKSTGSLMSQGTVYLTVSDSTSISNSKFIGNKSESESSYAMGGAVSSFGSNLSIENTSFTGNSVKGVSADGSAVYVTGNDWGGSENAVVNISNSVFSGNVSDGSSISRGAVFAGGDNANTLTVNITDSVFTDNVAKGESYVAGGAISIQDQKLNINITKDAVYSGNQAVVNGVADDSKGGFLFINSKNVSSDTSFNISDGATLTIGDGREGYDSIASRDEKAVINKTGAGALTVNGSMKDFTGTLNVSEGTMNSNNGLSSEKINVGNGATLNSDKGTWSGIRNEASWSNLEYYPSPIAEVSAGGTLNLSNATFENNSFIHNGSLASGVGAKGAIWVNGGSLSMSDSSMSGTESVTNPGNKDSWNSTPNAQGGAILFNGATSSGTFSNVKISDNSAKAMSVQGGAVAAFGGSYKIENGTSFVGNKAVGLEGSTSSISGGAIYATDSWSDGNITLNISDAVFDGNSAEGKISNGGAIIYESYNDGSGLVVENTSFINNSAKAETRAEGGALRIFTTSSSEKTVFNDVVFTGNTVEVESPEDTSRNGGGAIYANASDVVFNVTKDALFNGNFVAIKGEKSDYYGGFLRLSSYNGEGSSSEFNISDGATLTIGDGTAGQDSIASNDSNSLITKTGAGTLTVNGSMKDFTGTLNVSEGTMNINNGLGATKTIVDNSTANITGANLSGQNYVSEGEYGSRLALVEARNNAHLVIADSNYSNNSAEYNLSGVNGVYGSVVSSTESSTLIKNTVFEGNTNSTSAQVQGIVYLSGGDMEIESSSFKGNTGNGGANTTGAAVATYGGNLMISGTTFDGNVANSDAMARGGALYGDNYAQTENGTIITVSDSVFVNNKAVSQNDAWGGAAQISFAKTNNGSLTFKDTVFTNNTVEATSASGNAFGGAVGSRRADVIFEVSEGKNIVNTGNLAIVNGVANDANGGFLYMHNDSSFEDGGSRSTAYFNIASNASMTIGDGTAGHDSIASSDSNAIISKTGAGLLTVNSSMEYFTGALNVEAGTMDVNNKLGASSLTISSGATLGLKIGGENVLSNSALTSANYSNQGTLVISAKAGVSAGDYNISAGGITDYGNVKAYGGVVSNGVFKASETKISNIDAQTDPINVLSNGRLALMDASSQDAKIEMAFNSLSATVNGVGDATDSLKQAIGSDFSAIAAYSFDGTMASGDTVVLSFLVGDSTLNVSDFTVYKKSSGGTWEQAGDISGIEYDGEYLSFIASQFAEYGYAAVPEPAVFAALLGFAAAAFTAVRRRCKK